MSKKGEIIKFLWKNGNKTTTEIARELGISNSDMRIYGNALHRRQVLGRKKAGDWKTAQVTWSVARKGNGLHNARYYVRRDFNEELEE